MRLLLLLRIWRYRSNFDWDGEIIVAMLFAAGNAGRVCALYGEIIVAFAFIVVAKKKNRDLL